MSDAAETKQGPPNPQAEGVEAPTPPGGPLRQDGSGGGYHGGHDDDTSGSAAANKHAEESGGHTIPIEDEQPRPTADGPQDAVQEENAETSLDQPSEG